LILPSKGLPYYITICLSHIEKVFSHIARTILYIEVDGVTGFEGFFYMKIARFYIEKDYSRP